MFEYLIYPVIGFVGTLLALEVGWHFTACSTRDKSIKPCMFKQGKLALTVLQTKDLAKANEELKLASRLKDDFNNIAAG